MAKDETIQDSLPPAEGDDGLLQGGKIMSLLDHLGELRSRIIRSFVAVIVLFMVNLAFADVIIGYLKGPLMAVLPEGQDALHFTGPLDVFIVNIKVSFLTAVIMACPIWLYQFWKFFEPALYPKERRFILPFVVASVALFLAGVSFCYFLILPMALEFLIDLGLKIGIPIITIKDYISLLIIMIFGFGLVFETPIILILLAVLDLVTAETLAKNRRFVVVGILIVGAMFTPPDPVSQVAMALPVYGMYELSIVIIRLIKKDNG